MSSILPKVNIPFTPKIATDPVELASVQLVGLDIDEKSAGLDEADLRALGIDSAEIGLPDLRRPGGLSLEFQRFVAPTEEKSYDRILGSLYQAQVFLEKEDNGVPDELKQTARDLLNEEIDRTQVALSRVMSLLEV